MSAAPYNNISSPLLGRIKTLISTGNGGGNVVISGIDKFKYEVDPEQTTITSSISSDAILSFTDLTLETPVTVTPNLTSLSLAQSIVIVSLSGLRWTL